MCQQDFAVQDVPQYVSPRTLTLLHTFVKTILPFQAEKEVAMSKEGKEEWVSEKKDFSQFQIKALSETKIKSPNQYYDAIMKLIITSRCADNGKNKKYFEC